MVKRRTEKTKLLNRKVWLIIVAFLILALVPLVYYVGRYLDSLPIKVIEEPNLNNHEFEYLIDFETNRYLTNSSAITTERFLSGSKSGKLSGYKAYSPAVNIPVPTNDSSKVDGLNVSFWVNPSGEKVNVTLVFSVLDQNKNQIHWDGFNINKDDIIPGNWQPFKHKFEFPKELISTDNYIKVYLWNLDDSGEVIFLDDLTLNLNENFVVESPRSKFIDFENTEGNRISSKYSLSGFYSTFADGEDSFSKSITISMNELKYDNLKSISYSFHYLCEKPEVDAVFVISVSDSTGKDVMWQSTHLNFEDHEINEWDIGNGNAIIPKDVIDPSNSIKVYLWNRNDNVIYIDDVYLVIKEENEKNISIDPACDLIHNDEFIKKTKYPPYKNLYLKKCNVGNDLYDLNKVFTKSKKIITGQFCDTNDKDEILAFYNSKIVLYSFEKKQLVANEIKHDFNINDQNFICQDEGFVFIGSKEDSKLCQFILKGNELKLVADFNYNNVSKINCVIYNSDKSISIFENNGKINTFVLSESSYKLLNTQVLINTEYGNVKCIKGNFLSDSPQLVIIYLQSGKDIYKVFDYSKELNSWNISKLHSNKMIQAYDKLEFNDTYFVCKSDLNSYEKLLQFGKSPKFLLKLVELNEMSYEIVNNIDFTGFQDSQNPKYYEVSKIITGDFFGDSKTEVLIFQDNLNKVNWLTQKVEMYCFE